MTTAAKETGKVVFALLLIEASCWMLSKILQLDRSNVTVQNHHNIHDYLKKVYDIVQKLTFVLLVTCFKRYGFRGIRLLLPLGRNFHGCNDRLRLPHHCLLTISPSQQVFTIQDDRRCVNKKWCSLKAFIIRKNLFTHLDMALVEVSLFRVYAGVTTDKKVDSTQQNNKK